MKLRLLVLLCCASSTLAGSAWAQGKPLEVSTDTFVSLQWERSGGFAGIRESYHISNHEIVKDDLTSRRGGGGGFGAPDMFDHSVVVPLSDNQWKELMGQLKDLSAPRIAGSYKQEGLSDGFNETLRLTLSDTQNDDQTFTINNYGFKAPAAYNKFTQYLSKLIGRKFTPVNAGKVGGATATPANSPK